MALSSKRSKDFWTSAMSHGGRFLADFRGVDNVIA